MSLQPLNLPGIDTRLIKHDNTVYKLRFICQVPPSGGHGDGALHVEFADPNIQKEIERVIQVTLHRVRSGEPMCKIQTDHFLVDCVRRPWAAGRLLMFEQHRRRIETCAEMLVLTLKVKATDAVSPGDRVHVESSSKGRTASCAGHKSSRRTVFRGATDGCASSIEVEETKDMTKRQRSCASSVHEVANTATRASPVCGQSTQPVATLVRPTGKRRSPERADHGVTTRSGYGEKSLPKSAAQPSLSGHRTTTDTLHQHHHQSDDEMPDIVYRQTRVHSRRCDCDNCQTRGVPSLRGLTEQGVAREACRLPLQCRTVRRKREIQQEELREEMKLQRFAVNSPARSAKLSSAKAQASQSLKRSVYNAFDVIITPIKKIFHSALELYETPQK